MLPKAIDYFGQNAGATVYQMIWKSKHASALIQVEKTKIDTPHKHDENTENFLESYKK